MKARQSLIVLIALVCSGPFFTTRADQKESEKKEPSTFTLLKAVRSNHQGRPKAPDRQVVTCAYDGEDLRISFVIPEGTATLSVTDETLLTAFYQFDTTPLEVTVPVGALQGTVYVEMETESGNFYQGELE